jgi:hypothetical protein
MRRFQQTLSLALFAACLATGAQGQTLKGHWSGLVEQSGPGAVKDRYVATLTLDGATGAMDYPTLDCAGDVAFVSRTRDTSVYREHITRGPCIDAGTISVRPSSGGLLWTWSAEGVTASGRFYRVVEATPPHRP